MAKFLDKDGLSYVWGKIKTLLAGKANVPVTVNFGTLSSLPVTKTAAGITADMTVTHWEMGTPSAFTSPLTVTTANGSVTVSGGISGSSTLKIKFSNNTDVTGS